MFLVLMTRMFVFMLMGMLMGVRVGLVVVVLGRVIVFVSEMDIELYAGDPSLARFCDMGMESVERQFF